MASSDWFNKPQGHDFPRDIGKFARQQPCVIGFEDSTLVQGFCKLRPDSQSPRITLSLAKEDNTPTIVIGLQSCTFEVVLENNASGSGKIKQLKEKHPRWFQTFKGETVCIKITTTSYVQVGQLRTLDDAKHGQWQMLSNGLKNDPATIIMTWRPNWTLATKLYDWMSMLQQKVHSNLQPREEDSQKVPTAFWYYYEHVQDEHEEEEEETSGSRPIIPPYPWLRSDKGNNAYNELNVLAPYFIDNHERSLRLGQAMEVERQVQEEMVTKVFNYGNTHMANVLDYDTEFFHFHVRVNHSEDQQAQIPELAEKTRADIKMGSTFDSKVQGMIVDVPTDADCVVAVEKRSMEGFDLDLGSEIQVQIKIRPNLTPVENQIKAIKQAGHPHLVFGDQPGNKGKGFSLAKTVLAHGYEVDPNHPDYFALDLATMTSLDSNTVQERLRDMQSIFRLDKTQLQAYQNAVRNIVAGVNLIQGPPGTGKTQVAVAIIITVACLGHKILLAAGSNKAVDNLMAAIIKFLDQHPHLKEWCGTLARARTPNRQMSIVRAHSANLTVQKERPTAETEAEKVLMRHELPYYVISHARRNEHLNSCAAFLTLYDADNQKGLMTRNSTKAFRHWYEVVLSDYLQTEVRILATTLSNSAHESLQGFSPDYVVCDESGQCLEGDHMIAMTKPSVKAVALIGDPQQLPPTLLSENKENPGLKYAKRSLMERLQEAGYPCTMLSTNYRCHPHILDFFNNLTYGGRLRAAEVNSSPSRTGNVWESFVQSRFGQANLFGTHRVMISCKSTAESPAGSTSFVNHGQIDVALSLVQDLYRHVTVNGEKVGPSDVMFISPYKEHTRAVQRAARERNVKYSDNLTVDTAQGQEADIVVYMLVKPAKEANRIGLVADKGRLNLGLSRAKKVLIIIGNLVVWNKEKRNELKKNHAVKHLLSLLDDVVANGDVLNWAQPTISTAVAPVVEDLRELTIHPQPISEEHPRRVRRERSPDISDVEMLNEEEISHAPKRQRLDGPSSADKDDSTTWMTDSLDALTNELAALRKKLEKKESHIKTWLDARQITGRYAKECEEELARAKEEHRLVSMEIARCLKEYSVFISDRMGASREG